MTFWLLVVIAGITSLAAAALAAIEHTLHESRVAFDFLRTVAIITCGWCVVAVSTILDPLRMGAAVYVPPSVMATSTFLNFLIECVGWLCFALFRWQAYRGYHPWQRQGDAACDVG